MLLVVGSCFVAAVLSLAYGESLIDAVSIAALFSVIVASHVRWFDSIRQ